MNDRCKPGSIRSLCRAILDNPDHTAREFQLAHIDDNFWYLKGFMPGARVDFRELACHYEWRLGLGALPDPGAFAAKMRRLLERTRAASVVCLEPGDQGWPPAFDAIPDGPARLAARGTIPEGRCVAVVGTRAAGGEGLFNAGRFVARWLEHRGGFIVSGGALGIDTAAHRACLEHRRPTVAVLGTSILAPYPPQNTRLFEEIVQTGGAVLSPLPPGRPCQRWYFVDRNRLVAALGEFLVVIEAGRTSGSWTTAAFALQYGKSVYTFPSCAAPGELRGRGLIPCRSLDALCLRLLGTAGGDAGKVACRLSPEERRVLDCLQQGPLHFDELFEFLKMDTGRLCSILHRLEEQDLVLEKEKDVYNLLFRRSPDI